MPPQRPCMPVVTETKPKQVQWSLFDMVNETAQESEVEDTANDTLTEELDTDGEEFTEEEKLDAMRQVAEEEQSQAIEPIVEEPKGNRLYQDYKLYQSERPTAVVALRLGDFYEVLGDNAVMLGNEMDLTITSRDVGLQDRIPMVGFPYHTAENYFAKIVKKHDLYIIENDGEKQFIERIKPFVNRLIDEDTGEILCDDLTEDDMRKFDGDVEEPQEIYEPEQPSVDNEIIAKLKAILGDTFIVR